MPRPRKYPDELIQRGARLAMESGRPISHIAKDEVPAWDEGHLLMTLP
jgi:hypothetical protein